MIGQAMGETAVTQSADAAVHLGPVDWVFAAVMGIVEGLTEFIPVSSTGHLIVTARIFQRNDPAFEIAIQTGAITAILFLYWRKLYDDLRRVWGGATVEGQAAGPHTNLLVLIVVAALPASVVGLLFKDKLEELLFNNTTVGIALIVGGFLLLILDAWEKRRGMNEETALAIEQMTVRHALYIGMFQILALIPGTSRAGATIAGGVVAGLRRTAAAEFSFLVGLPILYGAAVVKMGGQAAMFDDAERFMEFAVACVASFLSALVVVKPFVNFLSRHTFAPFAWYRIVAGTVLLTLVYTGYFQA